MADVRRPRRRPRARAAQSSRRVAGPGLPPPTGPLRHLVSYHFFRGSANLGAYAERKREAWTPDAQGIELFADSGAFSATTLGVQITVEEYAAWVRRWVDVLDVVATLDVIGDPSATYTNTMTLRDLVGDVVPVLVPVVHVHTPWTWLERYLAEGFDYIALGGMVPYQRSEASALLRWCADAFRIAGDKAVFHGFGCTSRTVIENLPWYSVDSTSWKSAMRYGNMALFDDRYREWHSIPGGGAPSAGQRARDANVLGRVHRAMADPDVVRLLRDYGVAPSTYLDPPPSVWWQAPMIAQAWRRYERWLQERHGAVVVPGHADLPSGLRLFLA